MTLVVELPLRLHSAANLREHWAKKARRVKAERAIVDLAVRAKAPRGLVDSLDGNASTAEVRIVRIAPRVLDGDNLQSSIKAARDAVAEVLGVDDGSERVAWTYGQEKRGAREYGIRIEIAVSA